MRRGVTLLELLICVGIIAVLIGLLLSAVQVARAEAVRLKSQNKLRQIVLATHSYASAHQGRLPGYGWHITTHANEDELGTFVPILPFLEGDKTETPNPYHQLQWEYIPAYVSPADIRWLPCSNPEPRRPTFADPDYDDVVPVTAGGVTRPSVAGRTFQVAPTLDDCDYRVPQTPHRGMLTAYLDGSVRTTRAGVAPAVFWAAVTPAGGEVVADGW